MSRSSWPIAVFALLLVGCSQPVAAPPSPSDARALHYRNEEYGFGLTFNERWKGYEVQKSTCVFHTNANTDEDHPCFIVTLPTKNEEWNTVRHPSDNGRFEALYVGVFTIEQWHRSEKEVTNGVRKFATKVFALDGPGEQPSDVDLRDLAIPDVIESLETWTVK